MNDEIEQVNISYERVSNGRRAAAFLLDAVLSLITGAILLILTLYLLTSTPTMKSIQNRREEISLFSNLYVRENDSIITLKESLKNNDVLTVAEKNSKYDEALTLFYSNSDFFSDNEGIQIYLNLKKVKTDSQGNKLFDDNGNALYSDAVHNDNYWSFYNKVFDSSLSYLYYNNEYRQLNRNIILIDTFAIISTLLFPFIIFCYIIPLCNLRTRQTLGMMTVKIALIDANGLSVKWWKLTLRFLFFYVIELWGSIFAFFIPFVVSLTMAILMKSHQTLADYVCNTYMVNVKDRIIYRNVYEYKLANKAKPNSTPVDSNEIHIANQ